MTRKLLLFLLFLSSCTFAFSQFGIRANAQFNNTSGWNVRGIEETPLFGDGFSVGVDYWMRLKNVRVEFLPELNYGQYQNSYKGPTFNFESNNRVYSFFANTSFYFLDFLGDCDCPTWSKQGTFLKKGLFAYVSPGVSYLQLQTDFRKPDQDSSVPNLIVQEKTGLTTFSLGAGLGLDIGLSDLVTVTPIVGARYFLSTNWQELEQYNDENCLCLFLVEEPKSSILQLSAGLRIGFRLDN